MRRRMIGRAKRMTKEWFTFWTFSGTGDNQDAVSLAPNALFSAWILSPQTALDLMDEPTVIRMIFQAFGAFDNVVAQAATMVHMGIIVTRAVDLAGNTPVIDPLEDGFQDWLWRWNDMYVAPTSFAGNAVSRVSDYAALIDVRSKRKIRPGEGLLFVAWNNANSGGAYNFIAEGSFLTAHA